MAYRPSFSDPLIGSTQAYVNRESEGGGAGARLMTSLLGIQERREQRERQKILDELAAERFRQETQQQEFDQQLKLAEIAERVAAASKRPEAPVSFEDRAKAGDVAAMIPDTPEERAAWAAGPQVTAPTPTPTFQLPGGVSIPLRSREETQALADEDFKRKLDEMRRAEIAKGAVELTPEMIAAMPEELRPFFQPKQLATPPTLGSAAAALVRGERPQPYQRVEIDGVETMATPAEIAEAKAAGKRVAPYQADRQPMAGGVLIPVTNVAGTITGFYNNRTGQFQGIGGTGLPEGSRRSGVPAGELTQRGTLRSIISDAGKLRDLAAGEAGKYIGFFKGNFTGATRRAYDYSPDVQEMFHIADNLSDQLLRARSGAQINEQEYRRLRVLVPNPRDTRGKFDVDLDRFTIEANNILSARQGGPVSQELGVVDVASPAEAQRLAKGTRFRYKGKIFTRN